MTIKPIEEIDVGPVPLNPGIVKTVALLRKAGFDTCDSGDGVTHAAEEEWMPGFVAIRSARNMLASDCELARDALIKHGVNIVPVGHEGEYDEHGASIQGTYDVADRSAIVMVMGIHDRMLKGGS